MEYNKIIAVTGLPGLFELIASKNNGAIVRSLDEKVAKFVSSRVHNFSHLETIEVYTTDENVGLVEVFKAMKASTTALPDNKDNAAVKAYFEAVFPTMDFERVYASDMKKMVKWYEVLNSNDVEFKSSEEEQPEGVEETVDVEQSAPAVVEESPVAEKKKAAPKKKAAKATAETDASSEETEAPKKKAPAKKKKATEE